ncbi:MAG: ribonuclease HII, partial [Candidatus Cloacimonetes bacterium]|nr:ribonuclease HII [Candidatus Cloacimonadota bacterium]
LIDGNHLPHAVSQNCLPVIKGASKHACIAAASILAKVHRDRIMCALHEKYPVYGFDKHKGYPTKHHLYAISSFGICPEHRVSYAPIKQISIWELTGS